MINYYIIICGIILIPLGILILYIYNTNNQKQKQKQKIKMAKINGVAEKIKKIYNINSTEKTSHLVKLALKKPQYFNINYLDQSHSNSYELNPIKSNQNKLNQNKLNQNKLNQNKSNQIKSNQIKSNQNKSNKINGLDKINELDNVVTNDNFKDENKIINSYFTNKKLFEDIFFLRNKPIISSVESLGNFLDNNVLNKNNYNLLLKFQSGNNLDLNNMKKLKDLYIYANGKELIKIANSSEYEKIYNLIDSNVKIFLIENDITGEYYILHGETQKFEQTPNQIKKIFFANNKLNKNYDLISQYNIVSALFFVCTKI